MQQQSAPVHPDTKPRRRTARRAPSPSARIVSVLATADELNVSPRTIWRLLAQEQLHAVRCGKTVRITRESIERFIEAGGTPR